MEEQKQNKETDKIVDIAKKVLINLRDKHMILRTRYDYLKNVDDSLFTPNNPTRPFEEDAAYVMNEKDLTLISLKNEIDKLEGQIEGQAELIYKLSEAGRIKAEEELKLVKDNLELKNKVNELENTIIGLEENGKKE